MEQRKLIQHGRSSLTIALPAKWIKQYGLLKGESVYESEEGQQLIVSTDQSTKIGKISVDISHLDRTSALLYIQSLYRFGYNEIEVNFRKPKTVHYRKGEEVSISTLMHYTMNRLIGFEIVEQSPKRILIKQVAKEAGEDFTVILRRVFLLMKETSASLLEGIRINDHNLISSVEEKHDNITKFVTYCLRLLNVHGYPDVKKTCFYYHIIASLDKIVDILKYNARDAIKYDKNFHKDSVKILFLIHDSLVKYYELFYKFNYKKVDELSENRDKTKNLLQKKAKNVPVEELLYLTSHKQILEILLDLTDSRMGLEY